MFYIVFDRFKRSNAFLFIFHIFTVLFILLPFCIVIFNAVSPSINASDLNNRIQFINRELIYSLFRSFIVAFFTIVFVFILGYPFAFLVAGIDSPLKKATIIAFVTSPLWSSFFVKLMGLKSFFELILGESNSTRGLIYVVIGLVYVNLPIAILNFYNVLNHLPKNIVNASLDLGHNSFESVFRVVIPYTKESIIAVIFLVFLPSFTTVSVADFMNYDTGSKLVGQLLNNYSSIGTSDDVSRSRLSFVTIFLSAVVFTFYVVIKFSPSFIRWVISSVRNYQNKQLNHG